MMLCGMTLTKTFRWGTKTFRWGRLAFEALILIILIEPSAFAGNSIVGEVRPHNIKPLLSDLSMASASKEKVGDSGHRSSLFSEEHHAMFERDGFLVVSGLLEEEMDGLVNAGDLFLQATQKMKSYFSTIEMGMIFQAGKAENDTVTKAFRRVALDSILPQAVAELMRLPKSSSVRVLRDIFMSKAVEQDATCDWHVDDVGFWPESYISEHEGINVWIAMQAMPALYQGSMALAPGSHKADWRFDAYEAIGQNRSYHGGFTKAEMQERAESGEKLLTTCEMRHQNPELSDMIEATAFIPNIMKGDVIFSTRTLFHRTLAVTPGGKEYYSKENIEHLNRYSIRYVPGSARLPKGWAFEWSIMANEKNAGKSLDHTMERDNLLWYPQVWPLTDRERDCQLDSIAATSLDEVKAKARSEFFELISLFTQK